MQTATVHVHTIRRSLDASVVFIPILFLVSFTHVQLEASGMEIYMACGTGIISRRELRDMCQEIFPGKSCVRPSFLPPFLKIFFFFFLPNRARNISDAGQSAARQSWRFLKSRSPSPTKKTSNDKCNPRYYDHPFNLTTSPVPCITSHRAGRALHTAVDLPSPRVNPNRWT